MKQQIAAWAGHVGRELMAWFDVTRSALLWAFRRLRACSLTDFAIVAWVTVFIVIAILIAQDLSRDIVTIEPISTPKAFAENGYTPEVASRRLHDALNNYADNAGSVMPMHVALKGDLPDFVVPKLDLSVNAIVVSIRSALHYGDSQRITGEFTQQGKLTLRIRVDGREVYSGSNGSNDADALLAEAAPKIMDKVRPYLVASSMYPGDPEGAVAKADEIIARAGESDVNTQWSYILKSSIMLDQGKFDEAEKFAEKAIKLGWYNWVAHNNLGEGLQRRDKLDQAMAQIELAIAIEPSAAMPRYNRALVLRKMAGPNGKLDKAIAAFRNALDVDPRYSTARLGLAQALRDSGKLDEAIAEHRMAIRFASDKDPDLATYHYELGFSLARKAGNDGKLDEAVAEYKRALAIDPKLSSAHLMLGQALIRSGKLDEAIAEHRKALEFVSDKDPDLAVYHYELATALGQKANNDGKFDETIAECRRAISIDPKYASAHALLGEALKGSGKLDEGIAELRKAVEFVSDKAPDLADYHHALAIALLQKANSDGKFDEAIAEFRRAISINPKYAAAHNNLGLIWLKQGKLDDAVGELREAMADDPGSKEIKRNLEIALKSQQEKPVKK